MTWPAPKSSNPSRRARKNAWALARQVFGEHLDRRLFLGIAAIAAGSLVPSGSPGEPLWISPTALAVVAACLARAIDNNLTRRVAAGQSV